MNIKNLENSVETVLPIQKTIDGSFIHNTKQIENHGLFPETIVKSINHLYGLFYQIDTTLLNAGSERLGNLVELANLSAILGNVFRSGLVQFSEGRFKENEPHKFPDLLSTDDNFPDIEIKVCLETNKPKGHLVKPGTHLILRYVLGSPQGTFTLGKENRGNTPYLWEIKLGELFEDHFQVSNTEGDSGKTAVVSKAGMDNLTTIFFDPSMFPFSKRGTTYQEYLRYF